MKARRRRAAAVLLAGVAGAGAASAQPRAEPPAPDAVAATAEGPAPETTSPSPAPAPAGGTAGIGFGWPTPTSLGLFGDAVRDRLSGLSALPGSERWRLATSLSLGLIATDNSESSARGRPDVIVRLSAGVGLRYNGARVHGTLDYRLSDYVYLAGTRGNQVSNDLAAALRGDFFDRRLNVLANASIRRAATSAFVAQPTDETFSPGANDTERRILSVRAGWRSLLPSQLNFSANASLNVDDLQGTAAGSNVRTAWTVRLGSPRDRRLAWDALADASWRDSSARPALHSERVRGGVTLNLADWDLRLGANAGVEWSNVATSGSTIVSTAGASSSQRPIFGVQASWQPSRRTRATLTWDRRAYRDSWDLSAEYRLPLSFARLRFRSGVTLFDAPSLQAADGDATAGTLLGFLDAQLASRVPDAAQRLQQIGAFLVANGLDPSGAVNAAALNSTPTEDRIFSAIVGHEFSARSNATLTLTHSVQTRLPGVLASLNDDFALTSRLRRTSLNARVVHRVTPSMRATASLTLQQSEGDTAALRQQQQTLAVQLGGAGAYGGVWSIGARSSHVDNASGDYFVNAVFANLGWRF